MSFETTITHRIMEWFNNQSGVIMEKVKGEAECSGRSDINGCFHGRSVRIEVKTPDNRNKPSKKQLWDLWKWNRAGSLCMVTYSLNTVMIAFDRYTKNTSIKDFVTHDEVNKCTSVVLYPYCGIGFKELYEVYYGTKDDIQNKTVGTSD